MVEGIVTGFVVLAVFAVVASLLTLYVWRCDPYQFARWRAALRARREGQDASIPQSADSGSEGRAAAPAATMPPGVTSGKSASARLQYWHQIERYRGAP
jgi:hypothetical protein